MASVFVRLILKWLGFVSYAFFHMFGWSGVHFIGRALGKVAYYLKRRFRNILEAEVERLQAQMPQWQPHKDVIKKTFQQHYCRHVETLFFGALTKDNLDKLGYATGTENVDRALARGKGVILLLSHYGSFLLPLPYLGFRGYKVCQITGKQNHKEVINERIWRPVINEEIWRWRKKEADKLPVRFVEVGTFLRPAYKALNENNIIAIAFDGRESTKWEKVSFVGAEEFFSPGPFELARRTGATIIPTFVQKEEHGKHRIIFEKAFEMSKDVDVHKANAQDTSNFATIFGEYVKQRPCHFIVHFPYVRKPFLESY